MSNPLRQLTAEQLRRRTSVKWRRYPDDVLPVWVAEMDVPLPDAVVAAVTEAMTLGDTGYAFGPGYAEALAEFARDRWSWDLDVRRTRLVPDVMLGVVEVIKLLTDPGDVVFVNSPVYPPFFWFLEHMDRRVVEVPLTQDHRLDLDAMDQAFPRATADGRRAGGVIAHTAALREGQAWLDALLDGIDGTADCLLICWRSTCRGSDTGPRRARSWRGWTAARWESATTRRRCSWNAAGSRCTAGCRSGSGASDTRG